MSACVTGITGLQLYWNYQNYRATVKTFKHDINEALNTAVDREMDRRQQKIVNRFKKWLNDSSFVTITCSVENRDSSTVFHLTDTHPYKPGNKGISLGINDFKEKLHRITPGAKSIFINHMGDTILKKDLREGVVYFYTQRLGDSLIKEVNKSRHDDAILNKFYQQELSARGIKAAFNINPRKPDSQKPFLTRTINAGIQRPHQKDLVFAGFDSPDSYFLSQMKWLIFSSFLLIGITLFCFAYTVKTLLSQDKLAELKNDFVNNMTHELKTPVATINIAAEAIQDFNLSKASAAEYMDIIRHQAANLSQLIDQILKNAVAEKGIRLHYARVNVRQLIEGLLTEYKPQIEKLGACVSYERGNDVPTIADGPLLSIAIGNLLDNALKYSGPNIKIKIKCDVVRDNVIFSLADNGVGIPAQYQDKVFERFFRVPSGDIHDIKGYGLGLSYSKKIIEQHNGTIILTSKENKGTTFIVKIPIIYHETRQGTIA
jgi:two-component system phosphate regulon sensor histidine kinase PhoR